VKKINSSPPFTAAEKISAPVRAIADKKINAV
jgi:hypothetical protein